MKKLSVTAFKIYSQNIWNDIASRGNASSGG